MATATAERPALARTTIDRISTTAAILSTDAATLCRAASTLLSTWDATAAVATTLSASTVESTAVLPATRVVPISLSAAHDDDADQCHRTTAAGVSERAAQFSCASTVFLFHRLVVGYHVGDIRSYAHLYHNWRAYWHPNVHYVAGDHDALPEVNCKEVM